MVEYSLIFNSIGELACISINDDLHEDNSVGETKTKDTNAECDAIKQMVNTEKINWKSIIKRLCDITDDKTCKINIYTRFDLYKDLIATVKEYYEVFDKKIVVEFRLSPVVFDYKTMKLLEEKEKEALKVFNEKTVYNEEAEPDSVSLFRECFEEISRIYGVKMNCDLFAVNSASHIEEQKKEDLYQGKLNCIRAFISLCEGYHTGEHFADGNLELFKAFIQTLEKYDTAVFY